MPPKKPSKKEQEEEAKRLAEEEARRLAEEADKEPEIPEGETSLAWRVLGPKAMAKLALLKDPKEIIEFLIEKFDKYDDHENNEHSTISLDFYLEVLGFTRATGMTDEQASTVLTIMKKTLDLCTVERVSQRDAFAWFKSAVIAHAMNKPPDARVIFSEPMVQMIGRFATKTLFSSYRLYQFAFNGERRSKKFTKRVFLHTAAPWPPLEEFTDAADNEVAELTEQQPMSVLVDGEDSASPVRSGVLSSSPGPGGTPGHLGTPTPGTENGAETEEEMVSRTSALILDRALAPVRSELEAKWMARAQMLERRLRSLENS